MGLRFFYHYKKKIIGNLWDIIFIYLIFLFPGYITRLSDFFLHMSLYDFISVFHLLFDFISTYLFYFHRSSMGYSYRIIYPTWHIGCFFSLGVLVVSQKTPALFSAFISFGSFILAAPISCSFLNRSMPSLSFTEVAMNYKDREHPTVRTTYPR